MTRLVLAALAALLLFASSAQAHGAPTPLDAEDLVLEDEGSDGTVVADGFDITHVHVREAWMAGTDGIVVRWALWASDLTGTVAENHVRLLFDDPADMVLEWSTVDFGATWSGSGTVLEGSFEQDYLEGQAIPTWNVQFQAFVPLQDLGVQPGDSLLNMRAEALAGEQVVDIAPGGYYATGVPQAIEEPGNPSLRHIDSLLLDGPDRYTASVLGLNGRDLTVAVENLITVSAQHITITFDGASAEVAPQSANMDAARDLTVTTALPEFDVVQVTVTTDLGGREAFWVRSDGTIAAAPLDPLDPEAVATPAAPVAVLVLLVAVAASLRRR